MDLQKLNRKLLAFEDLRTTDLYQILRLRSAVFVVEQDCAYQDMDEMDFKALHYLVTDGEELVAYSRIIAPDLIYPGYSSVGRLVTKLSHRQVGLGRILMAESVQICRTKWPDYPIKIMAQSYLLDFYHSLGFQAVGEEFPEDGIPHRYMVLSEGGKI